MASDLAKLEDVKNDIRCLLISRNSQNITLNKLNKIYKDIVEEDIPYKDFYFTSLEKFLKSMPDVLSLRLNKTNELCAYHIDTEKSQHISSLVARKKPEADSNFKLKFKIHHNNPIDPHVLSEILQELKDFSAAEKRNFIYKTDVLSAVVKRIGIHTFYTIKDLNSQLNKCTHILTHEANYIYFKNTSLNSVTSNKNNEKKMLCSKLKEIDNQTNKVLDLSLVSNLIKETTKTRLKVLIEKYKGIWCSELPQIYRQEYGISLEYSDVGFNSIIEFTAALPDIFQIVEQLDSQKLMVLDTKIFKDICKNQKELAFTVIKHFKDTLNESKINSTQTMSKYYKALIPNDVIGFDDAVDQIKVNSLMKDPIENSYHVIVSEIHNPSFFWITLCKNKKKITQLMNKLQKFYTQENHNYKIPFEILKPGLHVTCIFEEVWHRGIVKRFKSNGLVVVHFYDYGTSSTFEPDHLYFLNKKFSSMPAQAIPCCLNNVKPFDALKWPSKVNKIFTKGVFDKYFIAYIINVNEENNSMVIDLVNRNNDFNEIYVSQWMIANKLAESGKFVCQINNITYLHYQECWNLNSNKKLNVK